MDLRLYHLDLDSVSHIGPLKKVKCFHLSGDTPSEALIAQEWIQSLAYLLPSIERLAFCHRVHSWLGKRWLRQLKGLLLQLKRYSIFDSIEDQLDHMGRHKQWFLENEKRQKKEWKKQDSSFKWFCLR